ncbi:hypothetical protein BGZ61DRAFT_237188 [Ilyonectria robusta]|uniref:uncharacterized protein n=1 Tax=Ilyonectria robusta TaxID=1079257 RepID=UPI001E8D0BA9|nr:uncharacterized protein BGZ61DRAFT_237188 [Ilyonectria robusta]KAH8699785.1 hypothetical protein BGZ61DRAFT_237188 [Ilyonectria robusta]
MKISHTRPGQPLKRAVGQVEGGRVAGPAVEPQLSNHLYPSAACTHQSTRPPAPLSRDWKLPLSPVQPARLVRIWESVMEPTRKPTDGGQAKMASDIVLARPAWLWFRLALFPDQSGRTRTTVRISDLPLIGAAIQP